MPLTKHQILLFINLVYVMNYDRGSVNNFSTKQIITKRVLRTDHKIPTCVIATRWNSQIKASQKVSIKLSGINEWWIRVFSDDQGLSLWKKAYFIRTTQLRLGVASLPGKLVMHDFFLTARRAMHFVLGETNRPQSAKVLQFDWNYYALPDHNALIMRR